MSKIFFPFSFLLLPLFLLTYPLDAVAQPPSDGHSNRSLISQLAEQNIDPPDLAFAPTSNTASNATYEGIKQFWYTDIFSDFFSNVSQFIRNLFISLTSVLCNIVKGFFLNTDLTQIKNDPANSNDLSYMINQLTDTLRGIAIDLLLLLFVLSIWRYWTQSSWHGNGSPMSAVARLIFTISTMLAWPKIYQFEIELSNEMITALFPDQNGQIQFLDLIVSNMLNTTTNSLPIGGLVNISSSTTIAGTLNGFTEPARIVTLVLLCLLGIILIYELIYVIILKAIQTALMTAQYVFAPFFLVFLGNPVTDNIATTFLRAFVEVSLWNFIWIGLLKILVILLYANFNPWGKILTTIGVLQLMMQVPQFMSHAKISVASDFVSPHFFTKFLKDISNFDKYIKNGTGNVKRFLGTDDDDKEDKDSHAKHPTTHEAGGNNFSFSGNNNNIITPEPPAKKPDISPGQAPNSEHNSYSNSPRSNVGAGPNFSSNSYMAGGSGNAAASSSASSTSMSAGTGFAFASAISIATATAINSSNGPNSGPPSGSPPAGPGPTPSDPGSDSIKRGTGPINPDLGTNRQPDPRPSPSFGSHLELRPSSEINTANTTSIVKSPNEGLTKNLGAPTIPPTKLNRANKENNSDIFNQEVNTGTGSKTFWDPFASSKSQTSAISCPINEARSDIRNASSIESRGQNILNQSHSFQLGAQNYHIYKHMPGSRANSYFYRSNKAYGSVEPLSGLASYNLIFHHGNSPTLMGIPPIYPNPNRI